MLLLKGLDSKKKGDERKKNVEHLKQQREKEKERRTETRRMEVEIMAELRRPVEDMSLLDEAKSLPEIDRVENMRLSGEAFANVLMIFAMKALFFASSSSRENQSSLMEVMVDCRQVMSTPLGLYQINLNT